MADDKEYHLSSGAVSEPAVAYSRDKQESIRHILEVTRASSMQSPDLAWIELARKGITKSSISRIAAYLDLSVEELCRLLHISPRTWQRKASLEVWDGDIAEHSLELAELAAKGIEVLGSIPALQKWVRSPLKALGQRTPLSIMDYSKGIRMCMDILGRLEHGVIS